MGSYAKALIAYGLDMGVQDDVGTPAWLAELFLRAGRASNSRRNQNPLRR